MLKHSALVSVLIAIGSDTSTSHLNLTRAVDCFSELSREFSAIRYLGSRTELYDMLIRTLNIPEDHHDTIKRPSRALINLLSLCGTAITTLEMPRERVPLTGTLASWAVLATVTGSYFERDPSATELFLVFRREKNLK